LYHMTPNYTSVHRPAINHVTARIVIIDFENGPVTNVSTVDSGVGVFLEPRADSTGHRTSGAPGRPSTAPKAPLRIPKRPPAAQREERR